MIKAIITDIEGTTTKLSFVKEVLFPYAYQHLPNYLREYAHVPEVVQILKETAQLVGNNNLTLEQATTQFLEWIVQDKKITPLKTLQGLIWKRGYEIGELKSHIYLDAAQQLMAWHQQGITLGIFSSGSILAQKLLFAHTEQGDLTSLFSAYFDTTTGAKTAPESYQKIAVKMDVNPENILFLSDIEAELDAASKIGMNTYILLRESSASTITQHAQAATFYDIKWKG